MVVRYYICPKCNQKWYVGPLKARQTSLGSAGKSKLSVELPEEIYGGSVICEACRMEMQRAPSQQQNPFMAQRTPTTATDPFQKVRQAVDQTADNAQQMMPLIENYYANRERRRQEAERRRREELERKRREAELKKRRIQEAEYLEAMLLQKEKEASPFEKFDGEKVNAPISELSHDPGRLTRELFANSKSDDERLIEKLKKVDTSKNAKESKYTGKFNEEYYKKLEEDQKELNSGITPLFKKGINKVEQLFDSFKKEYKIGEETIQSKAANIAKEEIEAGLKGESDDAETTKKVRKFVAEEINKPFKKTLDEAKDQNQ
jgi:hypothetical protein